MTKEKTRKMIRIVILFLLSFFMLAGTKVCFSGRIDGSLKESYINNFSFVDILLFGFIFCILYGVYYFTKKNYKKLQNLLFLENSYKVKFFHSWLIVTGILLIMWLPYLLSFAPGAVLGDSLASIEQTFSGVYSNHHPVIYTLLVGFFIKIGRVFGNINIGVLLYSCFQYLFLASTLGFVVAFLVKKKLKKGPILLTVLFFALCPIFPSYAIIMWKDPIFSIFLFYLSVLLYIFSKNNFGSLKSWHYSLLVICALGVVFFRNYGVFILMLIIPMLWMIFGKFATKIVLTILGVVVFSLIVQGPVYSLLKIHKPSVEAFSIPIQQISYVIAEEKDSLNNEDIEFLKQIMPLDVWKNAYTPTIVDSIKWHSNFDTSFFETHLGQFLKIWLRNMPSNMDSYIKAYLLETLGFWHPIYQNEYGYIDQYIAENNYGIHGSDLWQKITGESIKDYLSSLRPMISVGLIMIITFFSLMLCLDFQNKRIIMLFLSSICCWLIIMLSTPVAFSLRYVFVLMLMLPIVIVCPFFRKETTNDIIKK